MMIVFNPISGEWERINDTNRPFPVIARDTRLVIANNDTPFVPTLSASFLPGHTDLFGGTNSATANLGIYSAQAEPQVVVHDAWRIRRFVILFNRTATGTTNVEIGVNVYGRLIRNDGTVTLWRFISGGATDLGSTSETPVRLVVATSLSGVFGYDQYRIVFRRNPDSTPVPELGNIRVYAEF